MKLEYSLNEDDFLNNQLFIASKSERIRKKRKKSHLLNSAIFLFLAIIFYFFDQIFFSYYFIAAAIIFYTFYPLYERRHYRKHYQKHIAENYKSRYGITSTLSFTAENIETDSSEGKSVIPYETLKEVIETAKYYYITLRSGITIIIPKMVTNQTDNFELQLLALTERLKIPYTKDLSWQWK